MRHRARLSCDGGHGQKTRSRRIYRPAAQLGAYRGRLRSFPPVSRDLEAVDLHFIYVEARERSAERSALHDVKKEERKICRERSSLSVRPPGTPLLERGQLSRKSSRVFSPSRGAE